MSDGFQFLDILFFALIAVFIILRLRAVLGRRTGNERKQGDPFARSSEAPADRTGNVVRIPGRGSRPEPPCKADETIEHDETEPAHEAGGNAPPAAASQDVRAGYTQIKLADPSFDPRDFVHGARSAFGTIVEAFAKGETAALRPLLGDDVYDRFAAEIRGRLATGNSLQTRVIDIKSADIVAAQMTGRTATVTVRFTSEQITVTRTATGEVVSGDPDKPVQVTEDWSFSRNTRSRDPNWSLVETRSVA
jgi:predicted lipid-binding transport protein (Tim44 family)